MSSRSGLPNPRPRIRSQAPTQEPLSQELAAESPVALSTEDRSLLGPPPVTIFEDAEHYERLLQRLVADVKPKDVVELVWVKDVADLTWEVMRLQRAKAVAIAMAQQEALVWLAEVTTDSVDTRAQEMNGGVRAIAAAYLSAELDASVVADPKAFASYRAMARAPIQGALAKLQLSEDQIGDAALVQSVGTVERLDRLILISSRRRDAVIRDLERRRSDLAARLGRAVGQASDEAVAS